VKIVPEKRRNLVKCGVQGSGIRPCRNGTHVLVMRIRGKDVITFIARRFIRTLSKPTSISKAQCKLIYSCTQCRL
jgi:hypothetical protein